MWMARSQSTAAASVKITPARKWCDGPNYIYVIKEACHRNLFHTGAGDEYAKCHWGNDICCRVDFHDRGYFCIARPSRIFLLQKAQSLHQRWLWVQ
jgi:hypothetical protein